MDTHVIEVAITSTAAGTALLGMLAWLLKRNVGAVDALLDKHDKALEKVVEILNDHGRRLSLLELSQAEGRDRERERVDGCLQRLTVLEKRVANGNGRQP